MNKKIIIAALGAALVLCSCAPKTETADNTPATETVTEAANYSYVENAAPYVKNEEAVIDAIENINTGELEAFGDAKPSEESMKKLSDLVKKIEDEGHQISFIMADMKSTSGVSLYPDLTMCLQSTIKSVFAASLIENRPEVFEKEKETIYKMLAFSDNDAYAELYEKYGTDYVQKWVDEVGCSDAITEKQYPRATVRDMSKLWAKLFSYLNSGDAPKELCDFYNGSKFSASCLFLSDKNYVHSKAGWEHGLYGENKDEPLPEYVDGDPENDEVATNDTGVVYTEKGPYIFAVFTDYPLSDETVDHPLEEFTYVLNEVAQSIQSND